MVFKVPFDQVSANIHILLKWFYFWFLFLIDNLPPNETQIGFMSMEIRLAHLAQMRNFSFYIPVYTI